MVVVCMFMIMLYCLLQFLVVYLINNTATHFSGAIYSSANLSLFTKPQSSLPSVALVACIYINSFYIDCTQRVLHKEIYCCDIIILSLVAVGMCGGIYMSWINCNKKW